MGWGGARPGAGRKKPKAPATPPLKPKPTPEMREAERRSVAAMHEMIEASRAAASSAREKQAHLNPFAIRPDLFPPPAVPKAKGMRLAMDDATNWASNAWAASGAVLGAAQEGLMFLGYPYLSELAQRPEYRTFAETIATEATRKWIKLKGSKAEEEAEEKGATPEQAQDEQAEADDKNDKIKDLEGYLNQLQVRDHYAKIALHDGLFGRSHLYYDFGTDLGDDELKTPIGNGRDELTKAKVTTGSLKRLSVIEPVWTYPTTYNASNPLAPDWYNPQVWYVLGREIHASRIPRFVSREVPDILKPAYSFGGLSLTQLAKPYVDIWLTTRASVGQLIHAFSVMVLMTDLESILQPGVATSLLARVNLFNALRDNQGTFVLNKETEEFKNVSAPLSGLHELQAQAQEHMMSVARIPAVKFTGMQPQGLNASSEGEIRAFYDTIEAFQNAFFRPKLNTTLDFAMISLWGARDEEIVYDFEPLWALSEKEKGELRKADAETDQIRIDTGVVSSEEVRAKVAADPDSGFDNLDPNDVPDLLEEEAQGLQPEGGRPQPIAQGDPTGEVSEGGGANDAVVPFGGGADEAGFEESKHPRDDGGKFTSGSGGGKGVPHAPQFGLQHGKFTAPGGGSSSSSWFTGFGAKKTNVGEPIDVSKMKKVGAQMGSNPGGVFEGEGGEKFYVKRGKSKAHVRNEMVAAALYDLAGTPTLKYRPVEGGEHVATEMAKLDKDNAAKLSKAERAEAARDFAVHAWLANWDAVGTGGDNLGTVRGVPTALDLGGALEFRAQGAPKGKAFGTKVGELDTLRDGSNHDAAKMFGDMTPAQMRESARYVAAIGDQKIKDAVEKNGGDAALAEKLIKRRDDIAERMKTFGEDGDPESPDGTMVVPAGGKMPIKKLNGVAFKPWRPPADWAAVDGQAEIDEPEFFVTPGKRASTGVIVREADGRVWLIQPRNGYGGYEGTFPKGGLEKGLSLQANAIKETWEESGLKVKITGFAGDHEGDASTTRYYHAEREGGDPSQHDDESEGVVLVPESKAAGFLNRKRDQAVLAHDEANFEESKHPRDAEGKFATTAGGGGGPKEFAKELKKIVGKHGEGGSFESAEKKAVAALKNNVGEEDLEAALSPVEAHELKKAHGGSLAKAMQNLAEEHGIGGESLAEEPDDEEEGSLSAKQIEDLPLLGKAMQFVHGGGVPLTNAEATTLASEMGMEMQDVWDMVETTPPDLTPSLETKAPAATSSGGKKTAFGGLWKVGVGAPGSAEEFGHNVGHVLGKPTNAGSTYRTMLGFMMKNAAKHGMPEMAEKLKDKLGEAFFLAGNKAAQQGEGAAAAKAFKKAAELGYLGGSPAAPLLAPAEKAVAAAAKAPTPKAAAKAAEEVKPSSFPAPTAQELEKAKKSVQLQSAYVPGFNELQQMNGAMTVVPEVNKLVNEFNAKYEGKTLTDAGALAQKVNDFKTLGAKVAALKAYVQQNQTELQKKQAAKQKEAAAEQAKKAAAEKEKLKAQHAEVTKELGITEPAELEAFDAFVDHFGGTKNALDKFKSWTAEAQYAAAKNPGHGFEKLSGFEMGCIKAYTGPQSGWINTAIRDDAMTPAQFMFEKVLNAAIDKLPKQTKPTKRGLSLDAATQGKLKPGVIWTHRNFASSSSSGWGGNTKLHITTSGKGGAYVDPISSHKGEDETLFKSNLKLYIEKVENKGGVLQVYCKEM
jgi:phage-related protein (TIGR01555 family)